MNKFEIRIFYCDTPNPERYLRPRQMENNRPYHCELTTSLKGLKVSSIIYKILIK